VRQSLCEVAAAGRYARAKASVSYVPILVSWAELRQVIRATGIEASVAEGPAQAVKRLDRQTASAHQMRLLRVGRLFTLPLFVQGVVP
jgi:hypothetical protein